uniref:ShlB/FhaC/HecB family hemolysin secretion/activation protein n=1 Tax=Edaphosphingomonas laterariae TaxID=861865 RepID=UPI001FE77633|nr:ShlB/FhaC/HecB family hemolysin secretion/activation protein [Sphingomonas laterariae]
MPVPSQIRPPTREEIERPVAPPATTAPRLKVEGDIERAACPLADPAYANIKVTITDAVFNNLKGATAEELRPAYADYLGKEQPVAAICEIRDAAATLLRRKGYLAAVQVPTQKIENGTVRFEVLYARVTAIRVRGDAGRTENLIASYLNRLTRDEIFDRNNAERYLLLARDLPGHDVRLALRPAGTGPGELIGEVTVLTTPIEVDFNVQNYAAHDTGRWGGQVRAQLNGLTGMGDRTIISLYSTAQFDEQQILQLGHDFRVGGEGLTIGGRFTYAWTNPDLGVSTGAADLEARTLFANVEASYPFIRTQALNLRGAAGFDFVNQKVDFIGPLNRDKLRVAYLRLDADAMDMAYLRAPDWRLAGSFELRRGLAIFDASDACNGIVCPGGQTPPSRLDGDPTSTLVRFSGLLEYAYSPMFSVAVMPRAQYAFDPLFSFEEYSAGTYTIGRGYDPGAIIGDSGAGFQVEARTGRFSPFTDADIAFQPFAFVDAAWVWNKNLPGDPQKLTSVGGGVRASLANRLRLDMALAVPTRNTRFADQKGDVRFLVSLTTRLFPWGDR